MKHLKLSWLNKNRNVVLIALLCGTLGIGGLLVSHALTGTSSVEPENGTVTGSASVNNDSSASGGKSIKFGSVSQSGNFLKIYLGDNQAANETGQIPPSTAATQAQGADMININSFRLPASTASVMHQVNPNLKLYFYFNAVYAKSNQGPTTGTYDPSWYQKQVNGSYLRSKDFGNWLMDPYSSGWINSQITSAQGFKSAYGSSLTGIWLDLLTDAPTTSGWDLAYDVNGNATGQSQYPVNSSNQAYTSSQWFAATAHVANAFQAAGVGDIVGNGLSDGVHYAAGSSQLFDDGLSNLMAEGFLRNSGDSITAWPSTSEWQANVDMLIDAARRGTSVQAETKVWLTGDTQAEIDQWHQFALATFMLASDGNSYFQFTSDQNWPMPHPWWTTANQLGWPTGSYRQQNGLYIRNFANGLVVVNPGSTDITLPVSGTFTELDGSTVTSPTVTAHSGLVLR